MTDASAPAAQRARRPETRPAEIMEAAMGLFSSQGFRATTLDQVADAAGVTKGAIYHYFQGKEDLLLQSMDHWLESHLLPRSPEELDPSASPASARLRLMLRRFWERWMSPQMMNFVRLLEGELVSEFPELMEKWHSESVVPAFEILIDVVEEGKASGEFRKDLDTPVAVRFLFSGINKMAASTFHTPIKLQPELPPDRVIDSIIDVFFRGIRRS